ncbi:MAG: fibronectin/fibrinogen-binding protein, partial [Clostridiales bacterium]|nr:fibronectin/fibrinogen-binding protein [Clostridiales bacterium]
MANDLFTLKTLSDELCDALAGGKVEKIQQPDGDEVRITIRNKGKSQTLVLSCNPALPRAHITAEKKPNPYTALPLCMLLRKHIAVGALESVDIVNNDRVLRFTFLTKSDLKDISRKYIFVELMGRYSNIIFCDEDFTIIDAVKKTSLDTASPHPILRGIKYEFLKLDKTGIFSPKAAEIIKNAGSDLSFSEYISSSFSGFSKQTLSLMFLLANADGALPPEKESIDKVLTAIEKMKNAYKSDIYKPCVVGGEVFVYPPKNAENIIYFDTLSKAFDYAYGKRDLSIRVDSKTKELKKAAKRMEERILRYTRLNEEKIKECEEMDKMRLFGDLILSNCYRIKKGDTLLKALDYESGEEVEIPLDEAKTPAQNSEVYYSKYQKLKRTKEFLVKKTEDDYLLLNYVRSIISSLNALKIDDGIEDIERELIKIGAIHPKNIKNKRMDKPQPPRQYLIEGFKVLKGRNNIQNDEITFKTASAGDLWLHVKNAPSSHVIILTEG